VPCAVRWPGQDQAGHRVERESSRNHDWLPTFSWPWPAEPGGHRQAPERGHTIGDMTYKVHLDGYNLVPYLTGGAQKEPAGPSVRLLQRRPAGSSPCATTIGRSCSRNSGEPGTMARLVRAVRYPCACQRCFNLRHGIPFRRRADITSITYYDWLVDHVLLAGAGTGLSIGEFLATFREYPQRQKAASLQPRRRAPEGCSRVLTRSRPKLDWEGRRPRFFGRRPIRVTRAADGGRANGQTHMAPEKRRGQPNSHRSSGRGAARFYDSHPYPPPDRQPRSANRELYRNPGSAAAHCRFCYGPTEKATGEPRDTGGRLRNIPGPAVHALRRNLMLV